MKSQLFQTNTTHMQFGLLQNNQGATWDSFEAPRIHCPLTWGFNGRWWFCWNGSHFWESDLGVCLNDFCWWCFCSWLMIFVGYFFWGVLGFPLPFWEMPTWQDMSHVVRCSGYVLLIGPEVWPKKNVKQLQFANILGGRIWGSQQRNTSDNI